MSNILNKNVPPRWSSILSTLAVLFFLPFLLFGTYQVAILISRATEKPAVIAVNTTLTAETITSDFYHAFAQGGEEATDMLAPIASEVKALRPKFIRLDHLYDHYDVVKRNGDILTFDFSRLDESINTIRTLGATPVLALSYMPQAIAKDGVITNPPNNWEDWSLVVQKTIEHYSGVSQKNIPGIFYEVWNEPDLAQFGGWKMSGEKNYLTLYKYAEIGASRAQSVNYFYLGGPVTTGLYKNWIMGLAASGMRVDFLAWHTYLTEPKRYITDQDNLFTWLVEYPHLVIAPKLITEFGFSGDKGNKYGTMYAAAHTASVIQQLATRGVTGLFTFELKDGPNQESGNGWGLMTHESNGKTKKPRYHVYNFLDAIAGTRLVHTGGNSFVTALTTKKDPTIRVLLVNFDASGNHSEVSTVTLTNLTDGSYSYRQRFLLGQDVTTRETVTGGTLTKQIVMPAQSVALLELTRQ